MPGEAHLAEVEGLLLELTPHLLRAELPRQPVVLDHGEAELLTIAEEQRAGLGAREATRLGQNPLQQDAQVALAGQRDPDLHQLSEGLGEIDGWGFRWRQRGLPTFQSA
ncbi:MAG: hypothetical protein DME14_10635 [Candidatus Rokuibacteriota bacterium]|nr:MAG: hypothetical protein DME14_10635 [Candidatus Rokubacteria bacterium]